MKLVWAGLAIVAVVVVAAVVGLTSGGGDDDGQRPVARPQRDCAGPVLHVAGAQQPLAVRPGQRLTVQGRYYVTGCQDAVGSAEPAPIASVRLTLTDAEERRVVLVTAHPAGELGTFRVTTRIPRDTPRGPATIGDHKISSAGVRLVVAARSARSQ